MRFTRYVIGGLLIFITLSTYIEAIKDYYPDNYFPLLQSIIPITILDIVLVWCYSKGTSIYGTSNKQRSRWVLISLLLILNLLAFVYSCIQKIEADDQRIICGEKIEETKLYRQKLDSCLNRK